MSQLNSTAINFMYTFNMSVTYLTCIKRIHQKSQNSLKRALGVGLGGQDGCERRIKVFVKIQKKKNYLGGGVQVGGGGNMFGGDVRGGITGWM